MLNYTDSKYIANCRAWRIIWRESWKTFQTFLGRLRGVRGGELVRAGRRLQLQIKGNNNHHHWYWWPAHTAGVRGERGNNLYDLLIILFFILSTPITIKTLCWICAIFCQALCRIYAHHAQPTTLFCLCLLFIIIIVVFNLLLFDIYFWILLFLTIIFV